MAERQQELHKKNRELRIENPSGVTRENINSHQIQKNTEEINHNDSKMQEFVKIVIDTRKELDELFLVVDNVLFDNMIMLTKTTENFKVLERLKL